MAIYTVHLPNAPGTPVEQADRARFVRDGFSIWAFLFGPLFLLRHRAWMAVVTWIALVAAGAWMAHVLHWAGGTTGMLVLLLAVFVGVEGNAIRSAALARRGFDIAAVVVARRLDEGERRVFAAHPARTPDAPPRRPPSPVRPVTPDPGVIGLFPEPER